MAQNISLGISPCPNDTFIFHALLHGLVPLDYPAAPAIGLRIADVEKLNGMALAGELAFSKISLGVVPHILKNYRLLASGGALGFGCGPLVVRRPGAKPAGAVVATPGKYTTASLLLDLHGGFTGERRHMLFSEVMPAVARGEADFGVIIHEGRFTYQQYGLEKMLDLGEWWEEAYGLPLPLGAIAVRRDIARDLARAMERAIAQSLEHAWRRPADSRNFVRANAREMDAEVIDAHIRTFVTEFSRGLGREGRLAIEHLLAKSGGKNLDNDIFLG